jgi:hypothetical protein
LQNPEVDLLFFYTSENQQLSVGIIGSPHIVLLIVGAASSRDQHCEIFRSRL